MSQGAWLRRSLLVAVGLLLAACTSLLDIKERRLRAGDGDGGPVTEEPDGSSTGSAGGPSTGSGGRDGTAGMGSGGVDPDPRGACRIPDPPECQDCLCRECDPKLIEACASGACSAVVACVGSSGCTDPATCAMPSVCGTLFEAFPEATELLDCMRICSSCATAGPCAGAAEGVACVANDGVNGVCLGGICETGSTCAPQGGACKAPSVAAGICDGGNCRPCSGTPGSMNPECQVAYGLANACCSAQGSCESCQTTSCGADGTTCSGAVGVATGKGVCLDGQCVQCNGAANVADSTCMINVGGTRLCCSPAHTCETCTASTSCSAANEGSPCAHPMNGPGGVCLAGVCAACARVGLADPRCLTAYGPAQECCSATGVCTACTAGCSPGTNCPLPTGTGTCLASRVCAECVSANGGQDPNCATLHGVAAPCCYSNQCAPCVASCTDGVKNGAESDIDCGGPQCTACGPGKTCAVMTDCVGSTCMGGICNVSCTGGFQNCDGNSINGCETDVMSNASNCGTCGFPCTNPHGLTICAGGICTPSCAAGYGDCDASRNNGCETDVTSSLPHCGSCNTPCGGSCTSGSCLP